ncbi:hypothetical protein PoB_005516500 [Plakobranchus ocellatus]|uniref:Uncharacterized protein n=1 Tax=Plakobranchus ocellatus TaxID=259542 RepID=A0AAV4C7H4_9GAST|nr:hypothetical protein PoB_005516500 [Plakobranchus ocellatus]
MEEHKLANLADIVYQTCLATFGAKQHKIQVSLSQGRYMWPDDRVLQERAVAICDAKGLLVQSKHSLPCCIPDKRFLHEASSKINQVQASIFQESIEQGSDHAIERYQAKMLPQPPWIDISKWSSAQPEDNGYWDASLSNDTGETSSTNYGLCIKDTSSNQTAEQGRITESNDRAVNPNGYDNVKLCTDYFMFNELFETHYSRPAFKSDGTGMQRYGFENTFFEQYSRAFIDQAGLKNQSHFQAAVAGQDTDFQSSVATSVSGKNFTVKINEFTESNRASNATLGTNGASFALSDGNASNCNPWSVGDKPTEEEAEYQELVSNLSQGYKTPSQSDDCQPPVEKKPRFN